MNNVIVFNRYLSFIKGTNEAANNSENESVCQC